MDSLLFFLKMHGRAGLLRVLRDGYYTDGRLNKGLAFYSIMTLVILGVLAFWACDPWTYFGGLLIGVWAAWLLKNINRVYREYKKAYKDQLKYYNQERQYLRYLIFRDEVRQDHGSHRVSIPDALAYIEIDLGTEVTDVLTTSLFVTTIISFAITLIGSLIGKWDAPYIVLALFLCTLALLLGATVIGPLRSRKVRLLELKRYLLWLQQEKAPTKP